MNVFANMHQMTARSPAFDAPRPSARLQRHASAAEQRTDRPAIVDDVLGSSGARLDTASRAYFEPRFGFDFSQVRVHTDSRAAESARRIGAWAYTVADDVVFGAGQYAPGSATGRKLLAHELGHVAQQRMGGAAPVAQAENRARAAAERVGSGASVAPAELGGAPMGLYRDPDEGPDKPKTAPTLPPLPKLELSTPGPAEWLQMQATLGAHGRRLSLRDADDILRERERSSKLLDAFGIDDRFKLWFITKQWILNKGIQMQLEDSQERENPNAMDRLNFDWKNAHPGAIQTPIFPVYERKF
ncbi:MAG: DUF4157 domain-containing protein [Thiobacillaceae bacterium]